jgi:phosphatidylglycerol lysyltransferase
VAGLALIFATPNLPSDVTVPFVSLRVLGAILLVMVVSYVIASAKFKEELSFKSWSFRFPNLRLSLKQVAIASVDWLLMASVLYVLLPELQINFFSFVGMFMLAQIAGLFSQVPGGLGVFESVMLVYLTNFMPGSKVLGILVVYRIIYYIIPLLGALIVLGYQEYKVNKQKVEEFREKAAHWVPRVVPQVMSFSVFIGGAILLFSGAVPSEVPRMQWLQHFIPLPVIEMSHFLASLVGASLLVLAGALQRRIKGAYHMTIGLLVFGVLFSLLKGADYEEASMLSVMLVALVPCREEFHRKASLMGQVFSARWFTLIAIVLTSAVWLGIFSYKHVEYSKELWWEFSLMGDAPRYMRATVAALGFAVIIGLIKLLRPKRKETLVPGQQEMDVARDIIKQSQETTANLVLLGDKELMMNESQQSFIMFTRSGNNWVSMGDPVGPPEEAEEMIWEFRDECIAEGSSPVFYHVGRDYLEYYVDLGLTIFKLGEKARVSLTSFDPEKSIDQNVWSSYNEMKKNGYHWEMVPPDEISTHLPKLEKISEASVSAQNRRERGFSVGYFDEEYLGNFPIAVVKKDDQIVAFTNLLETKGRKELATDLLRYQPEVPENIINFILVETMLWGQNQGYEWFSLGMAPLSGMDEHDFSPGWNKLANFVYTYGENFYGFKTVRDYKNQFNPQWKPKFLVCPGGWALPRVLSNITSIVSGGFSNIVKKQ